MEKESQRLLESVMKLIAAQFGPDCEVVLHDWSKEYESTIVAIENGHVSGRKVGDGGSNLGLEVMRGTTDGSNQLNYITQTQDGRMLRSSSLYLTDENGKKVGALCINLDVTELGRINELIQTMKIGELNRFLEQQRQKGSDSIRIIEVERHARFVYPISTFILTLIGVSLSSRKVRGGTGLHIGLGVGLCFSYILLMRFFEEFAKSGTLPTGLSMWIPNILYCFIAIYLYKKAPK